MVDFTSADFGKCKYNLFEVVDVFKTYPELKVIYAEVAAMCNDLDWKQYFNPEQLMKFVVFTYHKPSPLISRIAELRERKTQALLLAGIEIDKLQQIPEAKKVLANILLSRHEFTTRLALHFSKMENNLLWTEYVHLLDILEDAMYELSNPNDGEKLSSVEVASKKAAVYKGVQQYRADLNMIAEKLFQQDADMSSFMSSHLIQIKRRRLISPEDFVKLSEQELTEIFRQQGLPV